MRRLVLLLISLGAAPAWADGVGFSEASMPDPPGEPLRAGIWYPAIAPASEQDLGLYTQEVAPGARIAGGGHSLIVISHGSGGSLEGHYDTALALAAAGFVVVAMTHSGDNYRDQSKATQLADRPRAVHAVIDYMLGEWTGRAAIDPGKVGMFGFSSGGFTALVAIGGVPDLSSVAPYCADHADSFVCKLAKSHGVGLPGPAPAVRWVADARIRAAVIAAPALGFVFSASGLQAVTVPVQLWSAAKDHILPAPDYADAVRAALPHPPEYHVVAGADHFDFLAPCSDALARVAPMICVDSAGFDRDAFHRDFNREVVRFFKQTLRP